MATLSIQQATLAGVAPSFSAASASDQFVNDGHSFLEVKNTDGSSHTVTVASQAPARVGYALANNTVTIPATTGDKVIGPFPTDVFNDANGNAQITYSATTGMTVAVIRTI